MPTANRRRFVGQALRYFLAQDYPRTELLVLDDGAESVADLVSEDERIRYWRLEQKMPLGAKRNLACEHARGELIAHWDDDDWMAPWRLRYQVEQLLQAQAEICGLNTLLFFEAIAQRAWQYVYPVSQKPWVYGASLCYTKAFWKAHPFPNINVGEDTRFVWSDSRAKIHVLPDSRFMVALVHDGNTSAKRTSDPRYHARPSAEVEQLLGADFEFYSQLRSDSSSPARPPTRSAIDRPLNKSKALVTAALGVGDILRVTPLIRVVHRLGYEVDVMLATDYPEVVQLLEGAPEIRRVFHLPSTRRGSGPSRLDGLADQTYDIATFTVWSAALRQRARSRRALVFERAQWLAEGDVRCVERIARELGWQGELPAPFALASARQFDLPPGTVAIHPGCKYEWPWKKWHGFDELARRFTNVVIVGSAEDLRTDNTYFGRTFEWPAQAQNFVGKLSLADTAALLRECAALIANDSGLMHLGVALGVPTFGIFGITSPAREAISAPHFHPITKGLPCEAACRLGAWGRRDCERHLECLKTLTTEDVFMKVNELIPRSAERTPRPEPVRVALSPPNSDTARQTINLMYYGYVFDASGYGQAARGYIHALHQAGVNVAVVDLANRARQVSDPLVESLVGRKIDPDFHLFHGIPPQWARLAFPLRNVIALTVWETDSMPSQWRSALTHAIDVWLPCEFNVAVFTRGLGRPAFKLPHALLSLPAPPANAREHWAAWGIREGDCVFYAMFEWQERKGSCEVIEAFLRAFATEKDAVLVLKVNPAASGISAATLSELRRRVNSEARVEIRCEAWSSDQMAALHARGDCYVSLHRGEGWNLPLFEAACLGKAVIATGYSGPMEYLDAAAHHLVRHRTTSVLQRYAYYSPSMHWAEPDVAHAAELMSQVLAEREQVQSRAAVRAERLRQDFSLETVGALARQRLLHLLRRTNPEKWQRLHTVDRQTRLKPPIPIPGEWYDADYFEHGLKSNWCNGYHWRDFAGLFRETAEFLTNLFPEAQSFLDAGCAKGFLVRSLREKGRDAWGFDHSPWAIDLAETCAKPFLSQVSIADANFGKSFDVVVAMSVFESLTEEQIRIFLPLARTWTRQAMFATIATMPTGTQAVQSSCDQDLSHITMKDREWWRQRFLEAGWRQDAIHRIAERSCQAATLATKMGWSVYLFSPRECGEFADAKSRSDPQTTLPHR